ncbi:MAG: hypothetical protein IJM50_01650 [Lachnospiraceae bacterium]|nr:hypothetical protein [Lachnospiraceae bacterium]
MLKKLTALFLAAVLALSAGCSKTEPTYDTTKPAESSEIQKTEEATSEETSTEQPTETAVDKQTFYEELFRNKEVSYAGESMKIVTRAEEQGMVQEIRFESAGQDSMMLIMNELSGAGYGLYSVGAQRYLYGNVRGEDGAFTEKLLIIDDPEFDMGEDDKPDLDFDEAEGDYRIEYAGTTDDGLDEVRYYDDDEEGEVSLFFDSNSRVVRIGMTARDEAGLESPVSMTFYDVESIVLPEGVAAEQADPQTLMSFMLMCIFGMMPTEGWEIEESSEEPETDAPVASVPSVDDMFLADRDLQIDYEGDSGTYTFQKLPKNAFDMMMLIDGCGLWTPYETAAFFIVALHTYQDDPDTADQMIRQLMAPDTTDAGCKFIESQLQEKPYLCDIYFRGVDMKTKKKPDAPYVIHVSKTTGTDAGYTYVKVWTDAIEGDRTIVLKQVGQDYYVVKCPALLLSLGDKPY